MERLCSTYRKGVNHGLKSKVHLAGADDLGHILNQVSEAFPCHGFFNTYAGVVGLKQSNLDTFVGEEALGLGKVNWSVVRRSMPGSALMLERRDIKRKSQYQLVKKVILSVDILTNRSASCFVLGDNSRVPI